MTVKTHIYIYSLQWKHSWREVYSDTDFLQKTRKISNDLTYYLKELDKKKKKKNQQKEGIIKIREEITIFFKEEKKNQ